MVDRAPTPSSYWAKNETVDDRYTVLDDEPRAGGMGLVYRVRHEVWGTDLAMKCPKPEHFRNAESRQRFVTEAETWVKLGLHPHVCSCYYVRTIDGIPCVFAEYATGGSLKDWIDDRRLYAGGQSRALARILDMAIQMAWGLEHAHSRKLVHQDVKPDNVVLDEHGTVKVTDFGLARARAAAAGVPRPPADPDATAQPGPRPGVTVLVPHAGGHTTEYASPEQAEGRPLDRRTDIYSFAVSVFEMFNGGLSWYAGPGVGRSLAGYRARGGTGEDWLPPLPDPLADLLERCLATDPRHRPRSMVDVAAELVAIHRQVCGRTYPRPEPAEADLLADELNNRALSLLDLGSGAEDSTDRSAEAEKTFREALEADPRHPGATYNLAMLRWRRGAAGDEEAVAALETARADDDSWQARQLLAQVHLERGDLVAAGGLLEGVARERPDEPEVLTALRTVRSGSVRTTYRTLRYGAKPKGGSSRRPVRVTPDGRLAVTGEYGAVRLWDLTTGRCLRTLEAHGEGGHGRSVHSVDIAADSRFAVSAGDDKTVRLWDLSDGRCLRTLDEKCQGVRLSPDGRLALWGWSDDGSLRFWNRRTGELTTTPDGHAAGVEQVEVSADGRWSLSSGWERSGPSIRLWELSSGRCARVLLGHSSPVIGLCFRPDGNSAVVAHQDRTIALWDLRQGLRVRTLRGRVRGRLMSLGSDGRFLLTGDDTMGDAQFWDLDSGRCLRTYRDTGVNAVLLDASGRSGLAVVAGTLSYGDNDHRSGVYAWELDLPAGHTAPPHLSRPRPHLELRTLDDRVAAMVTEAEQARTDGRLAEALDLLARARRIPGYERAPRVMDAWRELSRCTVRARPRTAWSPRAMPAAQGAVYAVELTHDGRHALVGGSDGSVGWWDVRKGTRTRAFEGHQHGVRSVCLSADARRAVSAGQDGTVRLWDVASGQCRRVLHMYEYLPSPSVPVRFGADGRSAVIGGGDGAIRVWDLDTGGPARTLTGHEGAVHALWVGADGRLAASAGSDRTVRLWDLAEGRCVCVLEGHASSVTMVCASADGASLLSCDTGYGRTIRLWDTATGHQVREFEKESSPNALCVTADGRFAFSAGHGSRINLWEVATGRCLRTLDSPEQTATTCLAVSPDGLTVVSGDDDGTLRSWLLDWELEIPGPADGRSPER
ncbi:protein kinase [Streptomyces sp. NBC_01591]|uniref:protein kinase domain-containing protein n=1 Tax=Streptomyces sp. NBC_01591 TaxID=2975888 RepID=UPI002DDC8D74|nr:protein kinase [Streptomyces sp. NBC_01591]WSD67278.1 protein kinase [Streptomyces sp. NBC_01591]